MTLTDPRPTTRPSLDAGERSRLERAFRVPRTRFAQGGGSWHRNDTLWRTFSTWTAVSNGFSKSRERANRPSSR